ncbi:MAG: group II intron reverse transcriptase/maturase, partial [Chloroflexales bacterium]|nr:group II intron reverse transcriptase/maturase [Chloroflexales bacterium]
MITQVSAPSHDNVDWHAINWQAVNENVRRLQARIVKAEQEGKPGKVKALQRLLTHSFSGKAMAVRRVTENQGKRTPGVDKETWDTPEKKAAAIGTLKQRGYYPKPLKRVYIPKKHGKKRPLGIPTMKDRAMQALYRLALAPIAAERADPNAYGFRPERSTADAIAQCFITLASEGKAEWVIEGDIKACCDQINHEWLENNIPINKTILHKWLKAGYIEQSSLYMTDEGTPPGGVISPTLANMALDGIELLLKKHFVLTRRNGTYYNPKVNLIRYADDFVITGATEELLENEVKTLVEQFLKERGLELSQAKTKITHIEEGFNFLGQNVRKYKDGAKRKLLIKPSKENVKTFLAKIREVIKANKAATAGNLIGLLNPIIRGWANFHRHIGAKETFNYVDNAIYQMLGQWAKRRHRNKPRTWIKMKYFKKQGGDNWMFSGERNGKNRYLRNAAKVTLKRHPKIKAEANPYDPQWEPYFEKRLRDKMEGTLRSQRQTWALWKEQDGRCPVCQQKITNETGWHDHHIIWKSKGGTDTLDNRVLLHPNCHMQVHSQGIHVAKPR